VLRPTEDDVDGPDKVKLSLTKGGGPIDISADVGTFTLLTGSEPDAALVPQGTIVRIWNDAAAGACGASASDASMLNGGGSEISTCESDGAVWAATN